MSFSNRAIERIHQLSADIHDVMAVARATIGTRKAGEDYFAYGNDWFSVSWGVIVRGDKEHKIAPSIDLVPAN